MTKPTVIISQDGDKVVVKTQSTFRNMELSAKLGEEFDETTPDDRHVKVSWREASGPPSPLGVMQGVEEEVAVAFPVMMDVLLLFAVHLHLGGRQAGAGAEVGRQGEPLRPGNQGRQDGDGERTCTSHTVTTGPCKSTRTRFLTLFIRPVACNVAHSRSCESTTCLFTTQHSLLSYQQKQ